MDIACIAIIDQKDQLEFIEYYIKTSDKCLFKFHAYSALYQINLQLQKRIQGAQADPYLGWILQIYLPENDYDVYSYVTVTQMKLLIFLKQAPQLDKITLQPIFEKIYGLVRASKQNPFGNLDLYKLLRPLIKEFNN